MTMYEIIKTAVSVKQAAEHYGLKVNRNGKQLLCVFENPIGDESWTMNIKDLAN